MKPPFPLPRWCFPPAPTAEIETLLADWLARYLQIEAPVASAITKAKMSEAARERHARERSVWQAGIKKV